MNAFPFNMFLGLREQNVTFCLDISGSMYNSLNTVKEHLIQYLVEQSVLANCNINRSFNLISFSTEVYPWANRVVLWNTAAVHNAENWIKDLETKTGTNTLDALLTAFNDSDCHASVLVTDDISDQDPFTVINQVSLVAKGRPVHCIYIVSGRDEDKLTMEFLQNLATSTRGSLKIVSIGRHGVEKITPICYFDLNPMIQLSNFTVNSNKTSKTTCCECNFNNSSSNNALPVAVKNIQITSNYQPSVVLSAFNYSYPKWLIEPSVYTYPSHFNYPRVLLTKDGKIPSKSIAWSRYRPVKVLYNGQVAGLTVEDKNIPIIQNDIAFTPDAGSLLINKTVLARSSLDGYYYKGKVVSQVLAHRFKIQFGPNKHGKYEDTIYQDTAIYDIIHYDDSIRHSIKTNDKILALVDGYEKYAPAEVLEGFEKRDSTDESDKCNSNKNLIVRFSNGKTRTCGFNEAIWLPDAMYERIKFEHNLPSTARKYLENFNDDYPNKSLPGYPNLSALKSCNTAEGIVMPRMVYDIWPYFVPFYPLYSNILYPAINLASQSNLITKTETAIAGAPMPITPTYFRQIRSNPAVVNAECFKKNVNGTLFTAEELDKKIRDQIYNHRNLIRSKSREKINYHENFNKCSCNCDCNRSENRHSSHEFINEFQNSSDCDCFNNSHNHSSHDCCDHHAHHNCNGHVHNNSNKSNNDQYESSLESSIENKNKYYKLYEKLIQELYDSSKMDTSYSSSKNHTCSHHQDSSLRRSKSVTFEDLISKYSDYNSDYESDIESYLERRDMHRSKEKESHGKKRKDSKNKINNNNVPDRFGNPKVNIGLPEKPLTRPRSASANLDQSLVCKSNENLSENYRKEHVAKREKIRQEKISNENKKQELRDQYHKKVSTQISDLEKKRTDDTFLKSQNIINAKKELHKAALNRIDSGKINTEAKEQMKYSKLRNQALNRNAKHINELNEQAFKEANKLAFKKQEQDKRNKIYHDRLLVEDFVRKNNFEQAQANYVKTANKEKTRETKGQKEESLKQSVKENNLIKFQANYLNAK